MQTIDIANKINEICKQYQFQTALRLTKPLLTGEDDVIVRIGPVST